MQEIKIPEFMKSSSTPTIPITIVEEKNKKQLSKANLEILTLRAKNFTYEEKVAIAAALDSDIMESELRHRRAMDENDIRAIQKIASRERTYNF